MSWGLNLGGLKLRTGLVTRRLGVRKEAGQVTRPGPGGSGSGSRAGGQDRPEPCGESAAPRTSSVRTGPRGHQAPRP